MIWAWEITPIWEWEITVTSVLLATWVLLQSHTTQAPPLHHRTLLNILLPIIWLIWEITTWVLVIMTTWVLEITTTMIRTNTMIPHAMDQTVVDQAAKMLWPTGVRK